MLSFQNCSNTTEKNSPQLSCIYTLDFLYCILHANVKSCIHSAKLWNSIPYEALHPGCFFKTHNQIVMNSPSWYFRDVLFWFHIMCFCLHFHVFTLLFQSCFHPCPAIGVLPKCVHLSGVSSLISLLFLHLYAKPYHAFMVLHKPITVIPWLPVPCAAFPGCWLTPYHVLPCKSVLQNFRAPHCFF